MNIYLLAGEDPSKGLWPYVLEIMATEGLPRPVLMKPEGLSRLLPVGRAVVIVPSMELSASTAELLGRHLRGGGGLLALKPCSALATELGLRKLHGIPDFLLCDGYLEFNRSHPLCVVLPPQIDYLQYHGQAEPYELPAGLCAAATLYWGGTSTTCGAIATGHLHKGKAAIFAYDLAASTMLFRQGLRRQSSLGELPDRSGDSMFTPNDLFVGFLDAGLRLVPQADLHARLFAKALAWLCEDWAPLPRLWYFPGGKPAVALINGDSDAMSREEMELYIQLVARAGGHYTLYLMREHYDLVPPELVAHYLSLGHGFGPHIWAGPRPTPEEFVACAQEEVAAFVGRYGFRPTTTRHHCVIWPGWVEPARALEKVGIRMDVNFRAAHFFREGYLSGSGLPMPYMDETGKAIEVLQQPTLLCDDFLFQNKSYLRPLKMQEVIALTDAMLEGCVRDYNTVFQAYFHPVYARKENPLVPGTYTVPWLEHTVGRCQELGVPMLSVEEWCGFAWARRRVWLDNLSFEPGSRLLTAALRTELGAIPGGLTVMAPLRWQGLEAKSVRVGGELASTWRRRWLGEEWLFCELPALAASQQLNILYGN